LRKQGLKAMQRADSQPKRLEIKKYPNRRYYDATHSRHLTLEEIRALIQQGYDLRVVDAKTSADITAQVLTQIILELETPKLDSLPVPLLLRLIRVNDQLVKDFIEKYFNQALQSFTEYQQRLEQQIRQSSGLASTLPAVTAWTKAVFGPFASAFGTAEKSKAREGAAAPEAELREVVEDLQRQVQELKTKKRKAPQRRRKR
jgi:polyhydroxyalkanoate synthesis repressor PhaR